jgi:hypothetical protein
MISKLRGKENSHIPGFNIKTVTARSLYPSAGLICGLPLKTPDSGFKRLTAS